MIGSLDKSFRGRGGVVYGTKSEEDVTDQSIGYTGCGGNAAWPASQTHAENSLVAEFFTVELKVPNT